MRSIVFLALCVGCQGSAALSCAGQGAPALLAAARDAVLADRPHDALDLYERALAALESGDGAASEVLRARALRGAADLYALELGDVRQAVEVYRELIRRCPDAPETMAARVSLAELLRTHYRDARGAIAELTAAIRRNPPESAELRYQVSKLYFELQDYAQVEVEVSELVRGYESSGHVEDALMLRAQALAMMEGRRADAARAFNDLATRARGSALAAHALHELGRLRLEAGERERAIEAWVQALEHHPNPGLVQASITHARRELSATTPKVMGDRKRIFERRLAVTGSDRTSKSAEGLEDP